jgi:hypothetical protein
MERTQNEKGLALIAQLAQQLNVDLKDSSVAIATESQPAKARTYDGSIEATVHSSNRNVVRIDSPRNPGICIEMVDHQRDMLAPKGAIYEIKAYMPDPTGEDRYTLNGDVFSVYVGREGIIIDKSGRNRIAAIPRE